MDVFEEEPVVGAAHPLLTMPNALCTPHLGYAEQEGYDGIYAGGVERLLAWAAGTPIYVINPEALTRTKR